MDRFSEQLIERQGDKKAAFLKGLVVAGAMLVIALLVLLIMWSGTMLLVPCIAAIIGAIWLAAYIWQGLNIEYEYIVTNDDLDIDKISGKRKRKRLMSFDLKSVDEFAPYINGTELKSDVTVLAEDGTGVDLWYIFMETEKNGSYAIVFNPDERTRETIIGGLNPAVRAKCNAVVEKLIEEQETEETE